jgi:DNA-binding protein HU-beta
MNHTDLCRTVAAMDSEFSIGLVQSVLAAATEVIRGEIRLGSVVKLRGLGSFSRVARGPRVGRDPRDGKPLEVPARIACKFKASSGFSSELQG